MDDHFLSRSLLPGHLELTIQKAVGLAAIEHGGESSPYVAVKVDKVH